MHSWHFGFGRMRTKKTSGVCDRDIMHFQTDQECADGPTRAYHFRPLLGTPSLCHNALSISMWKSCGHTEAEDEMPVLSYHHLPSRSKLRNVEDQKWYVFRPGTDLTGERVNARVAQLDLIRARVGM